MDPEKLMAELRDPANWDARPARRTDAFPARRPRSRVFVTVATIAIAVVVIAGVFSVVGIGIRGLRTPAAPLPIPTGVPTTFSSPEPLPSSTPSSTPTPSGTPIASVGDAAWTSPPEQVFGGDCNNLFSATQIAGFMGVPKAILIEDSARGVLPGMPLYSVVQHNGGLSCMWNDGTDKDKLVPGSHPVLTLTVLPASVLPGTVSSNTCIPNNSCTFVAGADGYLFSGSIGLNESIKSTLNLDAVAKTTFEGVTAAIPALTEAAGTPPAAYTPRVGDWATTIDCTSLYRSAGVWATVGEKEPAVQNWTASTVDAVGDAMQKHHGASGCVTGDGGASISTELLSGGAWLASDIASGQGVKPISIAGADKAYQKTYNGGEGDFTYDWVIDGPNLLLMIDSKERIAHSQRAIPGLLRQLDKGAVTATGASTTPVATTAGWGDLKLGSPVPASTKLVTWQTVDPAECAGNAGYWAVPGDPKGILVRTAGNSRTGAIEAITLEEASMTTKSGAHPGMKVADLRKLFPNAKVLKDGALYVVSDALGQVVFDVGSKNAGDYYGGPAAKNVVLMIHIIPTSVKPFTAQNMGFGPCI